MYPGLPGKCNKTINRSIMMEKKEDLQVLKGEIIQEKTPKNFTPDTNKSNLVRRDDKIEKLGKIVNTVLVIGGGILKFFMNRSVDTRSGEESGRGRGNPQGRGRRNRGPRKGS